MKCKGIALLAALLAVSGSAIAAQSDGCETKKQNVREQIEYARQHGNDHRVRGLERALANIEANCTTESLLRERQEKVAEKKREVIERQQDLEEARASGKPDKIRKRQRKLDEARVELDEATRQLERGSR